MKKNTIALSLVFCLFFSKLASMNISLAPTSPTPKTALMYSIGLWSIFMFRPTS